MSNDPIYLSDVVLSFPSIVEPRAPGENPNGIKKYSGDFIMLQTHPGFAEFWKRVNELALDKWKEHTAAVMQMIQNDRKARCYGAGQEKINKKTFLPYEGYVGNVFISANNEKMPQMIQSNGEPVDPLNTMACAALARKLYGGCKVNVAVKPWIQDNTHGRGIRCDLIAIQFAGDGTPFGEAPADAAPLFGAVAGQAQPAQAPVGAGMPAAPTFGAPAAQPGALPSFMAPQ
jgi:hypothetical protein